MASGDCFLGAFIHFDAGVANGVFDPAGMTSVTLGTPGASGNIYFNSIHFV